MSETLSNEIIKADGTITVKDFTKLYTVSGSGFDEIKFNSYGPYILPLRDLINKAGVNIYNKYPITDINKFDEGMEQAVLEFQKNNGLVETGIIDNTTLNSLILVSNNLSDIIYADDADTSDNNESETNNPSNDSFFSSNNLKNVRRNNNDIIITLGNGSIKKVIHNVYMRSVSIEYDTSGNPISETYEFIAQDLTESDEYRDNERYNE